MFWLHARYTDELNKCATLPEKVGQSFENVSWWGSIIAIISLQQGIPSKYESSTYADYVPALCTHRPSLLLIEWSGEYFGLPGFPAPGFPSLRFSEPYHLEEGEVVTRFP